MDASVTYSMEDLLTRLGTSKEKIGQALEANPQLKERLSLDPAPTGEWYKPGDSKLVMDAEGARALAQALGLDPALLDAQS